VSEYLLFLIVGLGAGAAYAAIAMALVTTYRGTGVINIAQGAMAMWAAFVYDELRRNGDLVLPVGRVHVGGLSTWPALVAAVAAVALLGLIVHLAVFRPLRSAPPLAKVVASVGVAITLEALIVLRFGTGRRAVPPALPDEPVHVGALTFSRDRIWFAALVGTIAVMLWATVASPARDSPRAPRPSRSVAPSFSVTRPTGSRPRPGCSPPSSAAPSPYSCRRRSGSSR
jgi:branched-subunit amino acid ABC-type transport system permease component